MAIAVWRGIRSSYDSSTSPAYVDRLFQSWLLPPWIFFAFRVLVALYAFTVIFVDLGYESTHGKARVADASFSYFTNLGYWGLAFYYSFAAAHTASSAARGREAWLRSWPGLMKWLHSVLYTTITVFPFVVTAVFWAVLSTGAFKSEFSTWYNTSAHALNSVFAFLEIVLPMTAPHPWINLVPLIVVLALYLGLAYLTKDTEGIYVYAFLNPANGRGLVAGACVGILAATIVVFVLVRYLIFLRQWLTERKFVIAIEQSTERGFQGNDGKMTAPAEQEITTIETQ